MLTLKWREAVHPWRFRFDQCLTGFSFHDQLLVACINHVPEKRWLGIYTLMGERERERESVCQKLNATFFVALLRISILDEFFHQVFFIRYPTLLMTKKRNKIEL